MNEYWDAFWQIARGVGFVAAMVAALGGVVGGLVGAMESIDEADAAWFVVCLALVGLAVVGGIATLAGITVVYA